jgi:hypothetical protein
MIASFRIGIDLEIVEEILETNADHIDGTRITLAAIDTDALTRDAKALGILDRMTRASPSTSPS